MNCAQYWVYNSKYPELQHITLPVDTCILDGELICFDQDSNPPKPCFGSLTTRFQTSKIDKIQALTKILPVSLSAFDIIFLNGKSLIGETLSDRLDKLRSIVTNDPFISLCPTFTDGESLFENVVNLGLEGIVSKKLSSKYQLNSRPQNVWYKTLALHK